MPSKRQNESQCFPDFSKNSPFGCHVRTLSPSSSSLRMAAPEPCFGLQKKPGDRKFPENETRRGRPTPRSLQIQKLTIPKTSQKRHGNATNMWKIFTEHPRAPLKNAFAAARHKGLLGSQPSVFHLLGKDLCLSQLWRNTSVVTLRTQEMVSNQWSASSFQVLPLPEGMAGHRRPCKQVQISFCDAIPCQSTGAVPTSGIWAAEICLGSWHFFDANLETSIHTTLEALQQKGKESNLLICLPRLFLWNLTWTWFRKKTIQAKSFHSPLPHLPFCLQLRKAGACSKLRTWAQGTSTRLVPIVTPHQKGDDKLGTSNIKGITKRGWTTYLLAKLRGLAASLSVIFGVQKRFGKTLAKTVAKTCLEHAWQRKAPGKNAWIKKFPNLCLANKKENPSWKWSFDLFIL